jgi:hypothetical protein
MLSWFRRDGTRKAIRADRRLLVARARRLLLSYLASDDLRKQEYYELIAGAAAACQLSDPHPTLESTEVSKIVAEAALRVVKGREQRAIADADQLQSSITDAYATVAVAYRRAAAVYAQDEEMQQVGTAAVHMVTMANSYVAAQSTGLTAAAG